MINFKISAPLPITIIYLPTLVVGAGFHHPPNYSILFIDLEYPYTGRQTWMVTSGNCQRWSNQGIWLILWQMENENYQKHWLNSATSMYFFNWKLHVWFEYKPSVKNGNGHNSNVKRRKTNSWKISNNSWMEKKFCLQSSIRMWMGELKILFLLTLSHFQLVDPSFDDGILAISTPSQKMTKKPFPSSSCSSYQPVSSHRAMFDCRDFILYFYCVLVCCCWCVLK